MYSIFVLDIADDIPPVVKYLIYADDMKFLLPLRLVESCRLLQLASDQFSFWCERNRIQLLPLKEMVIKHGLEDFDYTLNPRRVSRRCRCN